MIEIILSGEGSSDIGEIDYLSKEFTCGPIAVLTKTILAWHFKVDISFHFIKRGDLKRHPIRLPGKKKTRMGKGHSNLAYKLGYIARERDCHIAILMRDADNREFDEVYQEIRDGFSEAKFASGIPAVPVPMSKAWIISCIVPARSQHIEDCSCDMKVLLEGMLTSQRRPPTKETCCEIATSCRVDSIQSRSFLQYMKDIGEAVRYLS